MWSAGCFGVRLFWARPARIQDFVRGTGCERLVVCVRGAGRGSVANRVRVKPVWRRAVG